MVGKGRKRRPLRLPAILLIASGIVLLAAAVSLGKGGPDIANVQFAVDSSGAAPPPPTPPAPAPPAPAPPAAAPAPVTPPTVKIRGGRRTKAKRPVFTIGVPGATGVTYICRIGKRASTQLTPCASPFRAPNLGPGRHVLVVQTIDAAGNPSAWVKYPYFVQQP